MKDIKPYLMLIKLFIFSTLFISCESKIVYNQNEADLKETRFTGINIVNNYEVLSKRETSYKSGLKDGIQIIYHRNGQIARKNMWKQDVEHGFSVGYYDNGTIRDSSVYKQGNIVEYKFYTKNGLLRNHKLYNLNKSLTYYPDGRIHETVIDNKNCPR